MTTHQDDNGQPTKPALMLDFNDRENILELLPTLEAAAHEAHKEWQDKAALARLLRQRVGLDPLELPRSPRPAPTGDVIGVVMEVVNRENRKIRARDVAHVLQSEGHDVSLAGVSNALFYGARRAKPPRIAKAEGRGMYAPLTYREGDS